MNLLGNYAESDSEEEEEDEQKEDKHNQMKGQTKVAEKTAKSKEQLQSESKSTSFSSFEPSPTDELSFSEFLVGSLPPPIYNPESNSNQNSIQVEKDKENGKKKKKKKKHKHKSKDRSDHSSSSASSSSSLSAPPTRVPVSTGLRAPNHDEDDDDAAEEEGEYNPLLKPVTAVESSGSAKQKAGLASFLPPPKNRTPAASFDFDEESTEPTVSSSLSRENSTASDFSLNPSAQSESSSLSSKSAASVSSSVSFIEDVDDSSSQPQSKRPRAGAFFIPPSSSSSIISVDGSSLLSVPSSSSSASPSPAALASASFEEGVNRFDKKLSATYWNAAEGREEVKEEASITHKRKHQLNSLATKARNQEAEVARQKAASALIRQQAKSKYGW